MARSGPPAYAWDWFARQKALWRESLRRLSHHTHPAAGRYRGAEDKSDVLLLLRADYGRDDRVRETVDRVVGEVAFLDRTDRPFERLGVRNPPRGMRWWWTALTGEELDGQRQSPQRGASQLTLEEVHEGYGDPPRPSA